MTVSRRDFFASNADIGWIYTQTPEYITAKTGVIFPKDGGKNADENLALFHTRAEIAWRWIYADFMLNGLKVTPEKVDAIPKEKDK